ncbi:hypothetical protein HK101_003003, partial [Irineochytrium annulatum]
ALFPLIEVHAKNLAGKVTGMLLEMDNAAELLGYQTNTAALKGKVMEAMVVLEDYRRSNAPTPASFTEWMSAAAAAAAAPKK